MVPAGVGPMLSSGVPLSSSPVILVSDEILGTQSREFGRTSSLCVLPAYRPEALPENLSEMSSGDPFRNPKGSRSTGTGILSEGNEDDDDEDDDRNIDIEETDDERTDSENGDQAMTDADKIVVEKLEEEKDDDEEGRKGSQWGKDDSYEEE
ncbi:hypothetical protein Tco_0753630 [Tanacetum coccineum]